MLNRSYEAYARMCGFGVDACRAGKGSDNARAESLIKTLKVEAVYLMAYETFEEVCPALPRFIDT